MSDFQIKVEGGPEIIAKLSTLERKAATTIARTVLRQASKVIQQESKNLCPVDSGFLKSQIKVRAAPRKKDTVGVRVSVGQGWNQGDSFYGAFVAFGHKIGRRGLPDRKKTEPNNWMKEAFDNKAPQLANELPQMFWREIEKAV